MARRVIRIPEERIICLLKARDRKAFDGLYTSYANCLYNIALKIVHSDVIAEDVLQDSFIKIWTHIDSYDGSKGSLFTFILNITRNTAIDKIRSMAYKQEMQGLQSEKKLSETQVCFQLQVDFIGIDTYVAKLAPRYQCLIQYVYFQGYTHEETARVLRIPLGTVKTRLKAAVDKLKVMLL